MRSTYWQEWPPSTFQPYRSCTFHPGLVERAPIPELMAAATGVPMETIAAMKVRPGIGRLLMSEGPTARKTARPAPFPDAHCPECLAEMFSLRRAWSLSFVTCCPVHRCCLLDLCPHCGWDLDFYGEAGIGRHGGTEAWTDCWQCGVDLRLTLRCPPGPPVNDGYLSFQQFFVEQYRWNGDNDGISPRATLFDGLIHLAMAIAKDEVVVDNPNMGQPPGTKLGSFAKMRHRCSLNRQLCAVRHRWLHKAYRVIADHPQANTRRGSESLWEQLNTRTKKRAGRFLRGFACKIFPSVLRGAAWEWETE